jgi:hypothetical protein
VPIRHRLGKCLFQSIATPVVQAFPSNADCGADVILQPPWNAHVESNHFIEGTIIHLQRVRHGTTLSRLEGSFKMTFAIDLKMS